MGFLENRDLDAVPTITEFYKGKTILITGGTGFMGKVLIEKLLYSCTDLDTIYLLLRSKKGVTPEKRLADLFALPCFDRLHRMRPGVLESKVHLIAGDIGEINLGLTQEDRDLLKNNVNIIFHTAASIRFNDSLIDATRLNLRETKELVDLVKEMKNLVSFVHLSTCYANAIHSSVDEVIYPAYADWKDTLDICENTDEFTLNAFTSKYLGDLPNTYVFTKQLAETVLYEQKGKLPAVIIRPSVVIPSVEEPEIGWVDNYNGPIGMLTACGKVNRNAVTKTDLRKLKPSSKKSSTTYQNYNDEERFCGVMRVLYIEADRQIDYIPVDVSIKHMIVAAWIRGTKELEDTDDIEIYNCCSGKLKPFTSRDVMKYGLSAFHALPMDNIIWKPSIIFTNKEFVFKFLVFFLHLLPAILVDSLLCIFGMKPMLVKIYRKIYSANMAVKYYMTHQFQFTNDNFLALRSCIKKKDLDSFYYDIEEIQAENYMKIMTFGIKTFLLKEKQEDMPKAKQHYKRMIILDYVVKCLFFVFILWKLVCLYSQRDTIY